MTIRELKTKVVAARTIEAVKKAAHDVAVGLEAQGYCFVRTEVARHPVDGYRAYVDYTDDDGA